MLGGFEYVFLMVFFNIISLSVFAFTHGPGGQRRCAMKEGVLPTAGRVGIACSVHVHRAADD